MNFNSPLGNRITGVCGVLALLFCSDCSASNLLTGRAVQTVALSDGLAPSTMDGVTFGVFTAPTLGEPALNDAGQVAFGSFLRGDGIVQDNSVALWAGSPGDVNLVAWAGQPIEGVDDGSVLNSFGLAQPPRTINNLGETAFGAFVSGDTLNENNVWAGTAGGLRLVARSGEDAAGINGGAYTSFAAPSLNGLGQVALLGRAEGVGVDGSNNEALWVERNGVLELLAREGSPAPMTGDARVFGRLFIPSLAHDGTVVFPALIRLPSDPGLGTGGLWTADGAGLRPMYLSGAPAPGLPPGVEMTAFTLPERQITKTGQVGFTAVLAGADVNALNDEALYVGDDERLRLVARSGEQAPGYVDGVTFDDLGAPALNNHNRTAFVGSIFREPGDPFGENRFLVGLWSEGMGPLSLVARRGDQPAGVDGDAEFTLIGNPALNDLGQVAFAGSIFGDGVDLTNRSGIWAQDLSGELQLILRTGDQIEVAPGDVRTVRSFSFDEGPGVDGNLAFNNRGQVLFRAVFDDATQGVFISNVVAIPEPAAVWIAAGLLWLATAPRNESIVWRPRKKPGSSVSRD